MINPTYRFDLSVGGAAAVTVRPVYGSDLSLNWTKESGQQFFRASLSGELKFVRDDFDRIRSAAFDAEFVLQIYISRDLGASWSPYWRGNFYKTDCKFNEDDRNVSVTPSLKDSYTDILNGLDNEYNLVDLLPQAMMIYLDKRPMIQIYTLGESSIGCFMGGMWWETECEPVTSNTDLVSRFHFEKNTGARNVIISNITGNFPATIPKDYTGNAPNSDNDSWAYNNAGYVFRFLSPSSDGVSRWQLLNTEGDPIFEFSSGGHYTAPYTITMKAVEKEPAEGEGGTGNEMPVISGTIDATISDYGVYVRLVTDREYLTTGQRTDAIPADDFVGNNRNYRRAIGINISSLLVYSTNLSSSPTKWGLYRQGQYYAPPSSAYYDEYFPIAKTMWTSRSFWLANGAVLQDYNGIGAQQITMRDAYPIESVISVLLSKVAPGIAHAGTTAYSEFLYGVNPITNIRQYLAMTQKSNVINSGYDAPATSAPITLRDVFDMLRDCFRCYWFIDASNRLRIEHVSYFMRGGAYSGTPGIGVDLAANIETRNGKAWSFCQNSYEYDKPETAGRYQFGWADEQTEIFNGYPIEIISGYVQKDVVEEISVRKFSADVDYILLNPSNVSRDGFVLLSAYYSGGQYLLPYMNFYRGNTSRNVQNAYLPFVYLQRYYMYDLPAKRYMIDGVSGTAVGTERLKRQEVSFPCYGDIDTNRLIKTGLGNGYIEKISINLSSRNAKATLLYDSE